MRITLIAGKIQQIITLRTTGILSTGAAWELQQSPQKEIRKIKNIRLRNETL